MPMFEWKARRQRAAWLSAAIVAIAIFAACSGGRNSSAPPSRAVHPASPPAPSSRPTHTLPGNAGNAANVTTLSTQSPEGAASAFA
jgi:hypothetical protein